MELTTILNRGELLAELSQKIQNMDESTTIYYAPKELGKMDEINTAIRALSEMVDDELHRVRNMLRHEIREEQRAIRRIK